ncbi:MAG: hypothetical protein COB77_02335 [Gammaproteobacteria bacterium]|nr:MAG: hypothetical protein COB77_02335 [Gammaproteobacteria bacterium]
MWRVPVSRNDLSKPFAASCGPMWRTTGSTKANITDFVAAKCAPMWTQANAKTKQEQVIALLKKHRKQGETLQDTLSRLKKPKQPKANREQLIVLLKQAQKQDESLQETLDRLRVSKQPQETDAQLIIRTCPP